MLIYVGHLELPINPGGFSVTKLHLRLLRMPAVPTRAPERDRVQLGHRAENRGPSRTCILESEERWA